MKTKMFLIAFVAIAISACSESKSVTKVDKSVYHDGNGFRLKKIRVDSIDYVVVKDYMSGGVAIIRHSK